MWGAEKKDGLYILVEFRKQVIVMCIDESLKVKKMTLATYTCFTINPPILWATKIVGIYH